ncbi:NAD(P)H-quinone oxidoreductase [Rhodoferax sp. GW822-FHT02A01]|uniref:NAD(P)H-quinone oxidoreductase n=1 Tax=Rhodoferax sp. GW822-FHT02A01 TaxID=3141537 RepID=UPI00315C9E24
MKIMGISQPGGPEVLQYTDAPDPHAAPGEVVIDVVATAVNRADLLQRQGFYPAPAGAPDWPGLEVSGRISEVGEAVRGWSVGDPVCALLSGGGYAQKVAVPTGQLLPVPASLPLEDAAALPEVVCTVWNNLFMVAGLQAGEWLLVHGGGSGIGTMAIQMARRLGARVAVTAGSADKLERCRALGAELLINYREQDFVEQMRAHTAGHGADVILDIMGAKYLGKNVDCLAYKGRLVVIGLQGGTKAEINLGTLLSKRGSLHATALRSLSPQNKAEVVASVMQNVWPLVEAGEIRPIIHCHLPLTAAGQAHALVQESSHVGKVVLTVQQDQKVRQTA